MAEGAQQQASPAHQMTMGLLKLLQARAAHPLAPPPDQNELGHLRGLVHDRLRQFAQTHDPGQDHVTALGKLLNERYGVTAGGAHPLWQAWDQIYNQAQPGGPPGIPTPAPVPLHPGQLY